MTYKPEMDLRGAKLDSRFLKQEIYRDLATPPEAIAFLILSAS